MNPVTMPRPGTGSAPRAVPAATPGRLKRGRRRLKALLGTLAGTPVVVYLAQALHQGWFGLQQGDLTLQTGEYHWIWRLGLRANLACLGAVAILALAAPFGGARRAGGWLRTVLGSGLFFVALALFSMQYFSNAVLDPTIALLAAGVGALGAWILLRPGEDPPLAARLGRWAAHGGGRALPWLAAVAGAAVMVYSWRVLYQDQPVVTDSQSQIAQARLLLAGHWRLAVPQALRDVICFPYAIKLAPSYSQYPPGYILPLMGVIGLKLPPQALDVLTAALTVAATVLLARRAGGRGAAVAAAVLLLGSPFFTGLSGSGMNHSLAAALLAVAACSFIPAGPVRRAPACWSLLGGLCLGWAVMTRPVTGLGHALVWSGTWLVLLASGVRRVRAGVALRPDRTPRALCRQLAWAAAGAVLPAALFLFYNYKTTGHPLVMGYQVSNPELHRLGFHGGRLAFTPAMAWHRLAANFLSLSFLLFGWAVGSWVALLIWLWRSRLARGERVLAALIAVQVGLYAVYQFHDLLLGPRFLYEVLPAFAVLAGAGLAAPLRRGGWRAGTLLVLLVIMAAGGLAESRIFWDDRIRPMAGRQKDLDEFIRAQEPFREPTVILLEDEMEGEAIGRHFEWGKLWFVVKSDEAAARRLPELAGWRWIEYHHR